MLVNRAVIAQLLQTGEPLAKAANRCTGRSTGLALAALAAAVSQPTVWIMVRDHHGTADAHRHLLSMCRQMSVALGLTNMDFDVTSFRIRSSFAEYITYSEKP